MEETPLLKLPYLMPAQAQKHVTHNEALRMLDALLHIRVEDRARETPPEDPIEGQRHTLGPAPTGAFAGHAGKIAAFQDGAWSFFTPQEGWVIWDAETGALMVFDGADWTAVTPAAFAMLGVNATADETNRLTISGEATLLNHDGAGHQLKINKAAETDTGSLLFQTAWSGRAEMGLAGNDDFSIKVSANGVDWTAALSVDRNDGGLSVAGPVSAGGAVRAGAFTVSALPSASGAGAGAMIYISDEAGGATLAFSDGADWRRAADRAVVS